MIKVGVSDNDGIEAIVGQVLVTRNASLSLFLGVHSGVQHDSGIADLKQVAVGPDLSGPVKEGEASVGHDLRAVMGAGRGSPRYSAGKKLSDRKT